MQEVIQRSAADIIRAAEHIKATIHFTEPYPVGIILGSGLGDLALEVDTSTGGIIPYSSIPGFPVSTAPGHAGKLVLGTLCGVRVVSPGHAGKLVLGTLCGVRVVCMQGRVHLYEGYEPSTVAMPTRVMKHLGVRVLIVTNACGAVNTSYKRGDLMMLSDHINMTGKNPLVGPNINEYGPRFPDMGTTYTPRLQQVVRTAAAALGLQDVLKSGVYMCMLGPTYETPAEIRMARILGADTVGMSTVTEAIAARHCGMEVLGIACVCNMAAGICNEVLTEEDVLIEAKKRGASFQGLIKEVNTNDNKRVPQYTIAMGTVPSNAERQRRIDQLLIAQGARMPTAEFIEESVLRGSHNGALHMGQFSFQMGTDYYLTVVQWCAANGQMEGVEAILSCWQSAGSITNSSEPIRTAYNYSAVASSPVAPKNKIESVRWLVSSAGKNKNGFNAVMEAVMGGHCGILKYLVSSCNADVTYFCTGEQAGRYNGFTVLHLCAEMRRIDCAEVILAACRSDSQRAELAGFQADEGVGTALDVALESDYLDFVRMITNPKWGPAVLKAMDERAPLRRHCKKMPEVFSCLCEVGFSKGLQDAFVHGSKHNRDFILDHKEFPQHINVLTEKKPHTTCLFVTVLKRKKRLALKLLSLGADPNTLCRAAHELRHSLALPKSVITPLVLAVGTNQRRLAQEMSQCGGELPSHFCHIWGKGDSMFSLGTFLDGSWEEHSKAKEDYEDSLPTQSEHWELYKPLSFPHTLHPSQIVTGLSITSFMVQFNNEMSRVLELLDIRSLGRLQQTSRFWYGAAQSNSTWKLALLNTSVSWHRKVQKKLLLGVEILEQDTTTKWKNVGFFWLSKCFCTRCHTFYQNREGTKCNSWIQRDMSNKQTKADDYWQERLDPSTNLTTLRMRPAQPSEVMRIPPDLATVGNLHYHCVTWDPARAAPGIAFDQANTLVTQNIGTLTHKTVLGDEGFFDGSHYWSLKVLDGGPSKYIMIGVCDASFGGMFPVSHYPGLKTDGVSYYGANGYTYKLGGYGGFGPVFGTGSEVGVLLNMTHRTCTFFLNGTRVGTAAGADVLTGRTYFPSVSLYELGASVISLAVPPPPPRNNVIVYFPRGGH
ncbi:purine-nucleoside phosphorylase [Pelomyxa schiedti]|nr:purine-nucleoside phosphorylase [Pelomyxa schiedti]